MTVVAVDPVAPDPAVAVRAGRVLGAGGLVALPTETVYGLAAAVSDGEALARVFAVKGRPATDPLIVHVTDVDQARSVVGDLPDRARALARHFWPGPLTLVLPRTAAVPDVVTAGGPTVAVRVPAHPVALAVIAEAGGPVAAPSANRFGRISPTTAAHVLAELADRLDPSRDLVLDAGPALLGVESTVVDLTGARPRLLRPGGVALEDLEAVLGPVDHTEREVRPEADAASAPGRFLRHYAPTTPLVLAEADRATVDRLVAELADRGLRARTVDLPADADRAAPVLYATLREADAEGRDLLVVTPLPPGGLGRAVNDRLFRAAHGRIVTDASAATVDRLVALARS